MLSIKTINNSTKQFDYTIQINFFGIAFNRNDSFVFWYSIYWTTWPKKHYSCFWKLQLIDDSEKDGMENKCVF